MSPQISGIDQHLKMKLLGIEKQEIIDTVEKPDETDVFYSKNNQLHLFVKKFQQKYLLVLADGSPDSYTVKRAFPLYEDIITRINTLNPMSVLEKFCEEFCFQNTLQSIKSALLRNVEYEYMMAIPRSMGGPTYMNPDRHEIWEFSWDMKMDKTFHATYNVRQGMSFVINLTKFLNYIESKKES